MDFDDATKLLGQCGRFQLIQFFLVGAVIIPIYFINLGIVFLAGIPVHWCDTPEIRHLNLSTDVIKNLTLPLVEEEGQLLYSSCSRYAYNYSELTSHDIDVLLRDPNHGGQVEACVDGWTYDQGVYTSTIVSQFDLVCSRKWLQATVRSVFIAGLMLGNVVCGSLSDIVGRRPVFVFCAITHSVLSVAVSFSPNFIILCVLRFFVAFCGHVTYVNGFVIVMELIGPDYRQHAGIGYQYFTSLSLMTFAGMAYLMRDWFTLNLAGSSMCVVTCIVVFFVPESPRWLYVKNKQKKAHKIVSKIAKINHVSLPEELKITTNSEENRSYILDLCRSKRLALYTINICFLWAVNNNVYYGLSLNTSYLGGNDFINFFVSGAIEVPSYIVSQFALQYLGRRWPLSGSMLLGGLSLLLILAVPKKMNWVIVTLAMAGKFGITASFGIVYVYTAELMPTVVRNAGIATASISGRIGGIIAPYIAQLHDINRVIPMVIFGALSISAGLLALLLPETKGQSLPETPDDLLKIGKKRAEKSAMVEYEGVSIEDDTTVERANKSTDVVNV